MTDLRKKLVIFFVMLLIIILSCLFLIFHHKDTLKHYIKENVSIYIHLNPTDLNKLNNNHKEFILNQTSTYLGLSKSQLKNAINLSQKEIALTKLTNGNFQYHTFFNKNLENFLNTENIDFKIEKGIITFPVTISNLFNNKKTLVNSNHFIKNNFNFSLIKIYYSGEEPVFWPQIIGDYAINQPFTANIYYWNNSFNISTSLKTTATKSSKLLFDPKDSNIYFNSLIPSNLPITASLDKQNLPYLLLKNIKVPVEFYKNETNFYIFIEEKNQTISQITDQIKFTLSTLWPDIVDKELIDGTFAKHLVVNPENWQTTELYPNYSVITDNSISIYIREIENGYIISNLDEKPPLLEKNKPHYKENCLFYNNQHLYLNFVDKSFKQAVINQGFMDKINICIY